MSAFSGIFFVPNDPMYGAIKAFHGAGFRSVPIDGNLHFRSLSEGHENNQHVNIFAVPKIRPTETCKSYVAGLMR